MTCTSTDKPLSVVVASDQSLAPSTAYVEDTMLSSTPVTSTAMLAVFTDPVKGDGVNTVKMHTRGGTVSIVQEKLAFAAAMFPRVIK
jgi:hypothetical protein